MKKIAIITLAAILVLSSVGVGLAKWFDRIEVTGTVTTGSVDLNVVEYSCTYVYKDLEHQYPDQWNGGFACIVSPTPLPVAGLQLVSYACAEDADPQAEDNDTVTVTFDNLFPASAEDVPNIDFIADVIVHYEGSIPARLNLGEIELGPDSGWLDGLLSYQMYFVEPIKNEAGEIIGWEPGAPVEQCTQVHYCEYVKIDFEVEVPQVDEMMNQSGSFSFGFEAVQWNADCTPGPSPS